MHVRLGFLRRCTFVREKSHLLNFCARRQLLKALEACEEKVDELGSTHTHTQARLSEEGLQKDPLRISAADRLPPPKRFEIIAPHPDR